jgi:hypothetical protein
MLHRARIAARYHFRRSRPGQLVFVLGEPRVGSNLLLSYLESFPSVAVTEEVLNPWSAIGIRRTLISKKAALRHIRHSIAMPGDVAVAKLMLQHLDWHCLDTRDLRRTFPSARYLIIYRENLFEQYVSAQLLKATGIHKTSTLRPFQGQIQIDSNDLRRFCSAIKEKYTRLLSDSSLCAAATLISYEDLQANAQHLFDQTICPFLGLVPRQVSTGMLKQNTRSMDHLIENYEQLRGLAASDLVRQRFDVQGLLNAACPLR